MTGSVILVSVTYKINASNYDLKVTGFKACYDGEQAKLTTTRYNCVVGDVIKGDVNGDGKINAIDALWVRQSSAGVRVLTEQQKAAADVNGDGKINAIDALWITQKSAGVRDW